MTGSDFPRRVAGAVMLCLLAAGLVACGFDSEDEDPATAPGPTEASSPTSTATPTPEPTPAATPEPTLTPEPTPTPEPETEDFGYEIVNTFPHDPGAFTQGLEYRDGALYESTGRRGESTLRRVDLETGEVRQMVELDDELFGEGLTVVDDRIYQLTWQAGVGFVYDRESFERLDEFSYEGEGWGLANDGNRLIMSDGSDVLSFRDGETFEESEQVRVRDDRGPVEMLNELEFIDGEIWANIWQEDEIVVIDPETGWVNRRIDLSGLLREEDQAGRRVDVLNGIAWDEENERLFVTGKLWPVLYEIAVVPVE